MGHLRVDAKSLRSAPVVPNPADWQHLFGGYSQAGSPAAGGRKPANGFVTTSDRRLNR
jgi:hypothetical protein